MSIAKILMQIKLPGETILNLKKEVEQLSEEDKATLNRWYDEEQEAIAKSAFHAE